MEASTVKYNLTLSTDDGRIADWVAKQLVRFWGEERISASGFVREPNPQARVLTVIYDPAACPPYRVLEKVRVAARQFCVDVVEADIVGEIPLSVLLETAEYTLMVRCIRPGQVIGPWEGGAKIKV